MTNELPAILAKTDATIKNGVYWLIGGGLITLGTYASAEPGENYLIFWGPPAYGVLKIYRGYKLKSEIQKMLKNG